MRGKVAKKLRKIVYGTEFSPHQREYVNQKRKKIETGAIQNDGRRALYLNLKKNYKNQL